MPMHLAAEIPEGKGKLIDALKAQSNSLNSTNTNSLTLHRNKDEP